MLIHASIGMSAGMASSRMLWQVSSITYISDWFYNTTSSCYNLSCSIFIFCSLRTWSTRLSLARGYAIIPSYNICMVSHGSATILRPRPFSALTKGLSVSFDVNSAPSGSTMVFVICPRNICFAVVEPTTRLVKRVPTWGGSAYNSCNYTLRAPNTI